VGGIGSRWKEDERKESVLGEMSGRKRWLAERGEEKDD